MLKLSLSFAVLFSVSCASAQIISLRPLTAEQIAVYGAALEDREGPLHLDITTAPFRLESFEENKSCLQSEGILLNVRRQNVVHDLRYTVGLDPRIVLVDPGKREIVKKNDPDELLRSIMNGHPPVDHESLDELEGHYAFATDLYAFSEIAFNKQHTRAAFWHSSDCAGITVCGGGSLIVLRKVRGKWKMGKTCAFWTV